MGTMECSVDDECIHGRILFIDDLITFEAATVPEIKSSFEEAVDEYLEYCKTTGKPANKPYSGVFQVRISAGLHKKAAQAATRSGVKLNEYVTKAIDQAVEISSGIHINHHHDHAVKVIVQSDDEPLFSVTATSSESPGSWQSIPTRSLNG